MLNLDTHVLLHAVGGKLTAREHRPLHADQWSISAIVLWEIAKLAQLKRIQFDLDVHGDPADELIAATSLVHNVPLLARPSRTDVGASVRRILPPWTNPFIRSSLRH